MASILLLGLQNRKKEKRGVAVTEIVTKSCEPALSEVIIFLLLIDKLKFWFRENREENRKVKIRRKEG